MTTQSVDRTYPRHAEASADLLANPQEVYERSPEPSPLARSSRRFNVRRLVRAADAGRGPFSIHLIHCRTHLRNLAETARG